MAKLKMLKVVNLLLFVVFSFQALTGVGHNLVGDELFPVIHRAGGILLILVAWGHLWLNWGWVKASFLK